MSLLGIFGGTFDPIHYGHLRPAREARAALSLDALYLVPAAHPPHRRDPMASARQRLAMARLALEEFPELKVDDREIRAGGISYTVRTLESYRAQLGDHAPLCLLLGTDAFDGIDTWHQWQRLPELAHLVVLQRPGWQPLVPDWCSARVSARAEELHQSAAGRVHFLAVTPQEISATGLRRDLAQGANVSDRLPQAVLRYIHEQNLYQDQDERLNAR